jgi:hypothetical protein
MRDNIHYQEKKKPNVTAISRVNSKVHVLHIWYPRIWSNNDQQIYDAKTKLTIEIDR